ncbi:hypothetical protein [Natronomonas sp. EA1]|uniref:hypothetical protein n=1 Tax=Natronomonas sp. EA1 TaxID=3421655 RepID=UPI003EBAE6D5
MARAPHLTYERDELTLEMAVGGTRRRFDLSDRAVSLLQDDFDLDAPDIVPFVVAKSFVIAGAATVPDEEYDPQGQAWTIAGADGGREATVDELRALAAFLRGTTVDERVFETMKEHVEQTRLAQYLDPAELRSRADRVDGLRNIAKDL